MHEGADRTRSVYFRFPCGDLANRAILKAVHLGEEGRETGNCDISCEEVANRAWRVGIGVPDIGFRGKLERDQINRIFPGEEISRTIEIMTTFGVMTGQPWRARSKSIAAVTTTSYLHWSIWDAETRAAPAIKEERMGNFMPAKGMACSNKEREDGQRKNTSTQDSIISSAGLCMALSTVPEYSGQTQTRDVRGRCRSSKYSTEHSKGN